MHPGTKTPPATYCRVVPQLLGAPLAAPAGLVCRVDTSLKYAVIERERRFLVAAIPAGVAATRQVTDRYLEGSRLRLREVVEADGSTTRKLSQKIRLTDGPAEVACTNMYLDVAEWIALSQLAGCTLRKTRHLADRDGLRVVVDEFEDGTLLAEIERTDERTVLARFQPESEPAPRAQARRVTCAE